MLFGSSIDEQNNASYEFFNNELSGEVGIALLVSGIPWVFLFIRYLLSKRQTG